MWPLIGLPRLIASASTPWLRGSPMATCTKSIFSPRAAASGHLSKSLPILAGVRSPPAVSKCGDVAGVAEHPLDAGRVAHVTNFVAVAKNGRRAVEQCALGVGTRRHHRALDVNVGIDKTGSENTTVGVVDL